MKSLIQYFSLLLFIVFFAMLPGEVSAQKPLADFTSDTTWGCGSVIVKFTDRSLNSPTEWKWEFSDGGSSTIQNPSHTFSTSGTHTVTLTVTNAHGSDTKTSSIRVSALPSVDFITTDTAGCLPLTSRFTDLSSAGSGTITFWEWNFGDGEVSGSKDPSHSYSAAGTRNVSLKVTNSEGCSNSASKSAYIKVGGKVTAGFDSSVEAFCKPPVKVTFTNTTVEYGNMSYVWSFGDGNTSTNTSPTHIYNTAGTFTAKLVAKSDGGCIDSTERQLTINTRVTDFTGPSSICAGATAAFSSTSSPLPSAYQWIMGDGTTYSTKDITHTFSVAGTYSVTLKADFNGCTDSISKTIEVNPLPTVDFTASPTGGCKTPLTVNFTDKTTNASQWSWNFGDGTTSTQQNPSHTYNSFGYYKVSLRVTSPKGCSYQLKKDSLIKIEKPSVVITNLPANACAPFSYTPSYRINSPDPITSWFWDFGDGHTSNSPNPTNTYTTTGIFTVNLVITTAGGCTETVKMDSAVRLGNKVNVDFSANNVLLCGSQRVAFKSAVTGTVSSFSWDFGDGNTSSLQHPEHRYRDTGYFTVTLSVNSGGCTSSLTKLNFIRAEVPISKFEVKKDCDSMGRFVFNNTSIAADSYKWDFGDGNTSLEQSPKHTFTQAGSYTVKLMTASNKGCKDTMAIAVPVWLESINATTSRDTLCKHERSVIRIIHPSPSHVVTYYWDFGPGSQITTPGEVTPYGLVGWDYHQVGDYSFTGYTLDVFGCRDTITKYPFIRVNGPSPYFDTDNAGSCIDREVIFRDLSNTDRLHAITKWVWDFGDGTIQTYTAPPFSHKYDSVGTFSVKLTLTDQSGCSDTYTRTNYITTSGGKADFNLSDSFACSGKEVAFKNASIGNIKSYRWDFGDGASSDQENPTHVYSDTGVYTVKLQVTLASGCTFSVTKNNLVTVKDPEAKFRIVNMVGTCSPLEVKFADSSNSAKSWFWDFGDGNTSTLQNPINVFNSPGVYNTKLIITGPGGCKDSATTSISVTGPTGTITYSPLTGCSNLRVSFKADAQGAESYTWDFNDGILINGTENAITHTYASRGKYLPKVLLKDVNGCTSPVVGKDTIYIDAPSLNFGADLTNMCDSGTVKFTDSSQTYGAALSYKWNFGDGSTSSSQNPVHQYNVPGNYTIKLITQSPSGCTDTLVKENFIRVVQSPKGAIKGDSVGCAPADLLFVAEMLPDTSAVKSWRWNFGNGQTSTVQNPVPQKFVSAGRYNNSLTVTNSSGCSTTINKDVVIQPSPVVSVNNDTTICRGDTVQLKATGATVYTWSPSSGISCTGCASPLAYPAANQFYKVKASDNGGCSTEDSVLVKVVQPIKVSVSPQNAFACIGKGVQLSASGASSYQWSPAVGLSSANVSNPLATPVAKTTYQVIGADSLSCFMDSALVTITVVDHPKVDLGPDIVLPAGSSKTLTSKVSPDVTLYQWTTLNGLSCTTCPNPVLTANTNGSIVLKVTNNAGCSSSDTLKVIVSCNNSNVFVPNTFSPNGDGMNDIFYLRGTGSFTIQYFKVFNRWGETVFERKNIRVEDPSAGWNGSYKGRSADNGVYTYYIEVFCPGGEVLKYIGNISLIQ